MYYDLYQIKGTHHLFLALEQCRGVRQAAEHHPEGDVFSHSVQVLRHAMRESDDIDLIFAAMLHDVGKRIESHGHETWSSKMLEGRISPKTEWLIRNHMRVKPYLSGEMNKLSKVLELTNHPWFIDLVRLSRWDLMGRKRGRVDFDRVTVIERLRDKEKMNNANTV